MGSTLNNYQTPVGSGIEIPDMLQGDAIDASVDFSDTNITISIYNPLGGGFYGAPSFFSGPHIYDYTGSIPSFSSVTLQYTSFAGFDSSRISFDGDNIYLNFAGLATYASPTSPQIVSIDLNTSSAVPEPTSLILLSSGLGALAIASRRRKKQ